jgi:hypothetical protein
VPVACDPPELPAQPLAARGPVSRR